MAVPKFGRVKAARFLNTCRISQSKTVGGLSDRQRTELIDLFNSGSERAMPAVLVVTGPSGAGKGTLIRELVDRVPGDRGDRLGDDARAPARGGGRPRVLVPLGRGVHRRGSRAGEFLEHVELRLRPALRDAPLGARADRGRTATCRCSSSRPRARSRVKREVPGAVTIFISARGRRARAAPARAGDRERRRDRRADRARARAARAGRTSSTTWSRTTTSSGRSASSRRWSAVCVAPAGTMPRP